MSKKEMELKINEAIRRGFWIAKDKSGGWTIGKGSGTNAKVLGWTDGTKKEAREEMLKIVGL